MIHLSSTLHYQGYVWHHRWETKDWKKWDFIFWGNLATFLEDWGNNSDVRKSMWRLPKPETSELTKHEKQISPKEERWEGCISSRKRVLTAITIGPQEWPCLMLCPPHLSSLSPLSSLLLPRTAPGYCLEHARHVPTSGSSHRLFLLPKSIFPQLSK